MLVARYRRNPSFGDTQVMVRYSTIVSAHPATSADQNPKPRRSSIGISRNIGRDGSTYQNVAYACAAILVGSGLSRQSHIMPKTETSGSEAIIAPTPG